MQTALRAIVIIIGVAVLAFGVIFIVQSGSGKQQVADDIAPLTLDNLDAQYDAVAAQQVAMMQAEEPKIQSGTAQPSAMYNYLTVHKTGLGAARSNVGTSNLTMMMGIMDVLIGLGLVLGGSLSWARAR
jgi:hypothetical protein